jgi:thiol-disulfide isomerase/thioredoxin
MKLTRLIVAGSILVASAGFAADEKKSDSPAAAVSPADAAWAELEGLLKGPKERPKSQDEAKAIYTKHFKELDEKAAAFTKAHPNDPRRWKLAINDVQADRMRGFLGMPAKGDAEIKKIIAAVLAAPDADADSKAYASFVRVMEAGEDAGEFKKLADVHLKAYPDFKGNSQIESQLQRIETEKNLKVKPLDLKFTAVDGTQVDVSKMRGKVVLVDFWATWCGPCVAEIPNVVAAYKKLHAKGFEIVGISFDRDGDKEKLVSFTKEKNMTWPQYFDGKFWQNEFGQKYGINSIPTMWLVNKKGMVVDTNGRENLAEKVEKLLAE